MFSDAAATHSASQVFKVTISHNFTFSLVALSGGFSAVLFLSKTSCLYMKRSLVYPGVFSAVCFVVVVERAQKIFFQAANSVAGKGKEESGKKPAL
jgi:hypothetical protein